MPIIRNDIACFGENTCYSLAFFVPAVLMILSISKFFYKKNKKFFQSNELIYNIINYSDFFFFSIIYLW